MTSLGFKIASDQPVAQQLKSQIRALIAIGELEPAARLPTVKELSGYLRVNRNTVASAYQQLESEGFVDSVVGRGTFVADSEVVRRERQKRELFELASRSLQKAFDLGFDGRDFVDAVTAASLRDRPSGKIRALFIECNLSDANHYARQLEEHVGISVVAVELEELARDEQLRFRLLRLSDFVVTTFFHVEEVRDVTPDDVDVLALGMSMPIHLLMELGQMAPGSKIALVCDDLRCLENLRKSVLNAGISHLDIRFVEDLDKEALARAAAECDRVYGCRLTMKRIDQGKLGAGEGVTEFVQQLDRSGLDMVSQHAERLAGASFKD
jgi:GntR family transcriptional regulator